MAALSPSHCRFPWDVATYGLDRQFLWGQSLLVTPVLEPGADSVLGYFPRGVWYDFYTVRSTTAPLTFRFWMIWMRLSGDAEVLEHHQLWDSLPKELLPGPMPEPITVSLIPLCPLPPPRAPL